MTLLTGLPTGAATDLSTQRTHLSVDEFAHVTGTNPRTVRKWLREGKLDARKYGRLWRISASEVSQSQRVSA